MIKEYLDVFGAYLLSKTEWIGKYELPYVDCYLEDYPDYLAVYTEKRNYKKTPNTAVCGCVYDRKFDYVNNLYDAILYRREKVLDKYKERFKGVKYVCAPDYSTYSNMPFNEQLNNIAKSRMVFLWLKHECNLTAIPCAGFGAESTFEWCFDGIGQGSDVFIGLKGAQKEVESIARNKAGIKELVDRVKPRSLIVYSTADNAKTLKHLEYPISKGVKIIIPDNYLKTRNQKLKEEKRNGI